MLIVMGFGLFPLIPGGLMYLFFVVFNHRIPDIAYYILALLTLLLWGWLTHFAKRYIKSTVKLLLCLHVIPLLNLLLLGIQEFIANSYWTNFIGTLTQIYIFPCIKICSFIAGRLGALLNEPCGGIHWAGSTVFAMGFWSVLLMLAAAFLGCKIYKK